MEVVPEHPEKQSVWRRLKSRLEPWLAVLFLIPLTLWGFFHGAFTNGRPLPQRERRLMCLAIAMLAAILLCVCLGPLILAGFLALSTLEAPTNPGVEIAFALLFTLFGLTLLLVLHRLQVGFPPNPPRHGLALFFSGVGNVFWLGTALCGIVVAQLALPMYARWLSILFWTVAGIIVLLPLVGGAFKLLRHRLRQRAGVP